jgi:hypothetical protein
MVPRSQERRRGVILSSQGWQRLQATERLYSIRHNQAKRYTLEQLSRTTGLSTNTLIKLRRRQEPVDWPVWQNISNGLSCKCGPRSRFSVPVWSI